MLAHRGGELALELLELAVQRRERRDQREHELAAGAQLELADTPRGRATELCEQFRGLLPAGVPLAGQERGQARLAQPARVGRARVALKERERDPSVQIGEQPQRAGPEPLKLRTQLVSQRGPCADEVLPPAGQRPQRLGLIAVRFKHPEAMIVSARQLAVRTRQSGRTSRPTRESDRGPPLPGWDATPTPATPRPTAARPAARRATRSRPALAAQGPQPLLIVRERRRQQRVAHRISDEHVVLL
jgi:hypothetical protein